MGTLRKNTLGTTAIVFFVMSAAGPLVAMAGGVPIAMLLGNGPGIPALFAIVSIILCVFSIGYTRMARQVNSAGGFYALASIGLDEKMGSATGLLALLSYNALQIALYGLLGTAAHELFILIGIDLPWWVLCFAALISIAFFGYRQVDLSAKILGVLILAEYLIVLLLDVLILDQGGNKISLSAEPFYPDVVMTGAPWIALMLCFSAFLGFEATTLYSEEAKNPKKTIPKATYISVLLIGGFYTFSTWCAVMGTGVENTFDVLQGLQDPTFFMFGLAESYGNEILALSMRVLYVTSVYASLLAFHNAIARYFFSLGRDGLLPVSLASTHKQYQSPHMGSLAQSAVALIGLTLFTAFGADPILTLFTIPSALATLGILVIMGITSCAVFNYFRQRGELKLMLFAMISILAFVAISIFATINFDVLTGGHIILDRLLPLLLILILVCGALLSHFKST